MIPEKKVIQLLRAVAPKRYSLVALGYAKVSGGKMEVTDADRYLRVDVDAPDGVVNIALALKSGRIAGAYTESFDASECVQFPTSAPLGIAYDPALFGDTRRL